jgi:hypothetical protein
MRWQWQMKATTIHEGRLMMAEEETNPEVAGGIGARVLREIIRTPAFQEIIKANISGLDPGDARDMVKAFLREDIDLSISLLGMSPVVMNYLVEAVLELGRQFEGFPPALLEAFVSQMTSEIDREALKEIPEVYGPLLGKIMESPEKQEAFAAALGSLVTSSARFLNRSIARNPYFLRDVLANVDMKEILWAVVSICRSILSSLVSGVSRLIRR